MPRLKQKRVKCRRTTSKPGISDPEPVDFSVSLCPLSCRLCDEPTSSLEDCARHIADVHLNELSVCMLCYRVFVDKEQFNGHTAKHNSDKDMLSCTFCPLHFKNTSLLIKHDAEKHENAKPGLVIARYAPYLSAEINMNIYKYIKFIENGTKFLCRLCKCQISDVRIYQRHVKNCLKTKFVCDSCNQVFKRKSFLIKHMEMYCNHLNKEGRSTAEKIRCKSCKGLVRREKMDEHIQSCVSYKCKRCDETFPTMSECNDHFTKTHHGQSLQLKTCPHCRMEFIAQKMLDKHVKLHEKYRCLECGKMFRTPKPLLQHLKTHKNLEPYKCIPCNLTFKDGFTFKTHITNHPTKGFINFDENYFVVFSLEPPIITRDEDDHNNKDDTDQITITQENERIDSVLESNVYYNNIDSQNDDTNDIVTDESMSKSKETIVSVNETDNLQNNSITGIVTESTNASLEMNISLEMNVNEGSEINKINESINGVNPESQDKSKRNDPINHSNNEIDDDFKESVILVERPRRKRKPVKISDSDSDSEPLIVKKRKIKTKKIKKYTQKQKTTKSFMCTVCRKRMHDLVAYNRHINMHFKAGAKQCVLCAKILPNRATLDKHRAEDHSKPKKTNALHEYLKERAKSKLEAMKAKQREERRRELREKLKAQMQRPPFKMVLTRVASPTCNAAKNSKFRTYGSSVTIKRLSGSLPPSKITDQTLQEYVENFKPEELPEKSSPAKANQSKTPLLTTNKTLKIRTIRSTLVHQMFKIRTHPFKPERTVKVKGLKLPKKVVSVPEYHEVVVKKIDISEKVAKLNYGTKIEKMNGADVEHEENAEYFETDLNNDEVAQVEVSSTPTPKKSAGKGKGYVVELTGEPTSEQIEQKLAEVCRKLELPVQKEELYIGQLTTCAPFYRIVNVKQVLKTQKKKQEELKMRNRFHQIKIGNSPMVQVNPLAHLMKGQAVEEPRRPALALEVTPLQLQ